MTLVSITHIVMQTDFNSRLLSLIFSDAYLFVTHLRLNKWISVNDRASTTMDKEKRKRMLAHHRNNKMHKKNYLIPYSNHREKFTDMQSDINFSISYDPAKDCNCQFSALCHKLANIGISQSAETLREEIVSYLESHPNSPDATPMELFTGTPWD